MPRQVILLQITPSGAKLLTVDDLAGKFPVITRGLPVEWEIALCDESFEPLSAEELVDRS